MGLADKVLNGGAKKGWGKVRRQTSMWGTSTSWAKNAAETVDGRRKILQKEPAQRTEDDLRQLEQMCSRHKALSRLPLDKRRAVSEKLKYLFLAPNTYVFKEGDVGEYYYYISHGSVSVSMRDRDTGVESPINTMYGGDAFGELALMDEGGIRNASVITREACHLFTLTAKEYREILSDVTRAEFKDKMAQLQAVKIMDSFSSSVLQGLAYSLITREYSQNVVVVKQGQECEDFYFISKGSCKLVQQVRISGTPQEKMLGNRDFLRQLKACGQLISQSLLDAAPSEAATPPPAPRPKPAGTSASHLRPLQVPGSAGFVERGNMADGGTMTEAGLLRRRSVNAPDAHAMPARPATCAATPSTGASAASRGSTPGTARAALASTSGSSPGSKPGSAGGGGSASARGASTRAIAAAARRSPVLTSFGPGTEAVPASSPAAWAHHVHPYSDRAAQALRREASAGELPRTWTPDGAGSASEASFPSLGSGVSGYSQGSLGSAGSEVWQHGSLQNTPKRDRGDEFYQGMDRQNQERLRGKPRCIWLEVGQLHKFDMFGELGVLKKQREHASVVTIQQTRIYMLNKWDFFRRLDKNTIDELAARVEERASEGSVRNEFFRSRQWEKYKSTVVDDVIRRKKLAKDGIMSGVHPVIPTQIDREAFEVV